MVWGCPGARNDSSRLSQDLLLVVSGKIWERIGGCSCFLHPRRDFCKETEGRLPEVVGFSARGFWNASRTFSGVPVVTRVVRTSFGGCPDQFLGYPDPFFDVFLELSASPCGGSELSGPLFSVRWTAVVRPFDVVVVMGRGEGLRAWTPEASEAFWGSQKGFGLQVASGKVNSQAFCGLIRGSQCPQKRPGRLQGVVVVPQ